MSAVYSEVTEKMAELRSGRKRARPRTLRSSEENAEQISPSPIFRVVRPGLITTIQDLGRPGHAGQGVPWSGAMDRFALQLANCLVGNAPATAGLEFTLTGPELHVLQPCLVALTGSRFDVTRSVGPSVPFACAFRLHAGERLNIGPTLEGARGYLAIAGGIISPLVMGSQAALTITSASPSAALGVGQELCGKVIRPLPPGYSLCRATMPAWETTSILHALPTSQEQAFTLPEIDRFYSTAWRVSTRSDRVGICLEGPAISASTRAVQLPESSPPGTILIQRDGRPVLLGVDGPWIGILPQLGNLLHLDFWKLAHLKPGDLVRFIRLDADSLIRRLETLPGAPEMLLEQLPFRP